MLRDNRLLWSLSFFVALYWITGFFVPGAQLTALASVLLVFGGLITLSQYAPVGYRIIFHRLRNEGIPQGYGAHLAVLGTTMLATGAVWAGGMSAAYIYNGSPASWLDYPFMGFGRYLMAGGFTLAHISPAMTQDGLRVTWKWAVWVGTVAALLFGILVGVAISRPELVTTIATCVPGQPIKGNVSRHVRLYHLPGTPQYAVTIPEACFDTEVAAVAAGYARAGRRRG